MKSILLVALGGAIGAVLRYLAGTWIKGISPGVFPWHTVLINLSGCLAIGIIWALFSHNNTQPDHLSLFVIVGILGGYTTFSSFGLETFTLIRERMIGQALSYVLLSNLGGIAAVFSGYYLCKAMS